MARASETIFDAIGGTPAVRLRRVVPAGGGAVFLKLEHLSPNAAMQDRVAVAMARRAEAEGLLEPGASLVVPGCGNTAIGLAMIAAERGLSLTAVMPEHVSIEQRQALKSYRAAIELTPAERGMAGARARAQTLAQRTGAVLLDPYADPACVEAHRQTASELLETIAADGGRIDAFALGVGTGAAITAIGRALKERFTSVQIAAVEPMASVLAGDAPRLHRLLGIGVDFVPPLLDRSVVDRIVRVDDRAAWQMRGRLAREEGLLVGMSTGAHVAAAVELAGQLGSGARIYTLACDTGERYFSYAEQFG